ncbi:murein L,D-transpeptidase catalytic domain family protein [Flavobacterium sp. 5]|uniref:murein L,D-transpeptidase catalytic domain family protein n=1 Tax=Flavobacterium sp. 5 TaxID=2035199 RepID=UPI000CC4539D|nr:murein L,D-transpeptidase catalytic domain family protein [Flavobacterium sp. 5]PKB16069.1 L,D-transpeptidase-like protein [Flavobacterium sp. 5]
MNRYTVVYKSIIASIIVFVLFAFTGNLINTNKNITKKEIVSGLKSNIDTKVEMVYNALQANQFELPKEECFVEALKGFYSLKERGIVKSNVLTLVDFSLSSNAKRLWIIDLSSNIVLFQTLVAHGRNTGEEFANNFSNTPESFKSSLGFYVTGEVYNGKHGISLKLDGLEKGLNDNARNRAVVLHGADYVSESFIKDHKRLGRSQGCPAVPVACVSEIITMIKGQSCLYIYHPSINNSKQNKLVS